MYEWKIVEGPWTVAETTRLAGLTIGEDAALTAPEGKSLTLTVDGVQKDPVPGQYQGEIVLTVTDQMPVAYRKLTHDFRAALLVEDGRVSEKSVTAAVTGGTVAAGKAEGICIESQGEAFNCVYITGSGEYTIKNARLRAVGNGGNDFCGWGSALTVHGTAKVLVEDTTIETIGAARNAAVVSGHSDVTFRNCQLHTKDGTLPWDYVDTVELGFMKSVPWMLGLRGNCRTTNLCGNASVTYEHCHLSSGGWGVLSVDDMEKGSLTARDCLIEITGPSGYGAFAIGEVTELFDHCTIRVPDYGLIGGMGTQAYTNGTHVISGRNALTAANGKTLTADKGCVFEGGMTTILNKGGACDFLLDSCVLRSGTGVLLQTEISDDPRSPTGYYIDPRDPDVRDESIDIYTHVSGADTLFQLRHMQVEGDVYNGTTQQKPDTGPGMMPPMPEGEGGPEGPVPDGPGPEGPAPGGPGPVGKSGARNVKVELLDSQLTGVISASTAAHRAKKITKENCGEIGIFVDTPAPAVNNGVIVELDGASAWTVTGISYLTRLTLAPGAKLLAPTGKTVAITLDGKDIDLVPGDYQGRIVVTPV